MGTFVAIESEADRYCGIAGLFVIYVRSRRERSTLAIFRVLNAFSTVAQPLWLPGRVIHMPYVLDRATNFRRDV